MAMPLAFLFATLATLDGPIALRTGCDGDEPIVAQLGAGQAVEIRSSITGGNGVCYKVALEKEGRQIFGYVPARALKDTGSYDDARRAARDLGAAAQQAVAAVARNAKTKPDHPATQAMALVEANQPAEALRLLERDLQRYPRDAYLQAAAGLAYYRMDQLDRALLHWRESTALEPNRSIDQLIARAEREKSADKGSERMIGVRVALRYERGVIPEPLAQAMLQVLDEEYTRIAFQLGCRAAEKVTAIAQSRQAYMAGTQAVEWSGGMFDGRIHVPVSDSRVVSAQTRKVFAHELTHACLHELGSWPSWLQEGLAQVVSGDRLPAVERAALEQMIRAGRLPKLSALGRNWSGLNAQNARIAYLLALYGAEQLTALYSTTGSGNVLRNPQEFSRVEAAVEKSMGY